MERLKWLREEKEENQQDLADLLKVSQSTIGKWENGNHEPNFEMLIKLADHYDVSIDYLVGYTNIRKKHYVIDDLLREYLVQKFDRPFKADQIELVEAVIATIAKHAE